MMFCKHMYIIVLQLLLGYSLLVPLTWPRAMLYIFRLQRKMNIGLRQTISGLVNISPNTDINQPVLNRRPDETDKYERLAAT